MVIDTRARLQGLLELGNDSILLGTDILLEVIGADFDLMQLLEGEEHASEVLTNEFLDEGFTCETGLEFTAFADFIDEVGASLESELLGEDESVVAIEEEGGNL